ncbi:cell division protein FtsW [Candidatus Kaiserbacteria bacterium]|nr:cell division protein FtsW [Candidatus Kaiserbacteria bacterium]
MKFGFKAFPDTVLLLVTVALLAFGLLVFSSASLGLFAREGIKVSSIVANHFILGFGLGSVALFICAALPYRLWKVAAPYLYVAALGLTALVFVPTIGLEHGGSMRWLEFGPLSLQPSESLKVGLIMALAAYFTTIKGHIHSWYYGLGGFLAILAIPSALLLLQPDHGTLGVILITAGIMFITAGGDLRQIAMICIAGTLITGFVFATQPYVRERVLTFIDPGRDPSGASYQVQQSLLALGSGELTGRGLGQGIQKFQYLPEPVGDSIFAVIGEEFGFIGTTIVVMLFALFLIRGFSIGIRAPDYFGGLMAVGIVSYITVEAFLNMAAMLSLVPLTGIPLIFMSQGGTALFVALGSVGILVNISRHAKRM